MYLFAYLNSLNNDWLKMRALKYARAVQFSSRQSALNMINFTCNFGLKMAWTPYLRLRRFH